MGILQSWNGKYHQLYAPCPREKVRTSCFQTSLHSISTPHRKNTLSDQQGKYNLINKDFLPIFHTSFTLYHGRRKGSAAQAAFTFQAVGPGIIPAGAGRSDGIASDYTDV